MHAKLGMSARRIRPVRQFLRFACAVLLIISWIATAHAQPSFSKSFNPVTIGPGSISTLTFNIFNENPTPATDMAFTDTLPAGLTLATPANPTSTCAGIIDALDGDVTISFSEGTVAAGSGCSVSVDVTGNESGTYTNTSGDLTSSEGNSGIATDSLTIDLTRPGFRKSFAPDISNRSERSTLTFTIDNTANEGSGAFSLTVTDNLPAGMVVADPANAATTCIDGIISAVSGAGVISYSTTFSLNAAVDALSSCIITVDVVGTAVGPLINVTGELNSATSFSGQTRTSGKASAVFIVTTDPLSLGKSFTDDPVIPGATVTLEFTIANTDRNATATNISFSDDLDATLTGLAATGLPLSDVCGAGSQLSGTSVLTLSGGNLAAEQFCTFSVTLQVPAAADAGAYLNVTSALAADLGGVAFTGSSATETLFVNNAPALSKTFLDNPIGAGDTTTVEFTITNTSATSAATTITFSDNLDAFVSGTTVTSLPAAGFCGAGSTATTTSIGGELTLIVSGGNLAAGGSCTFSVDLLIPEGAPGGNFINTTGAISATVDNVTQTGKTATDTLTVAGAPALSKSFTNDPVQPGEVVTLEFTITHGAENTANATGIAFTDDLNAALAGLTATGLPLNEVCGAGSQLSGTAALSFTGGSLVPGASCTFSVSLQVPAAALPGTYSNTTSSLTATVSSVGVTGNPGSDTLRIGGLELTKSFTDDPVIPGDTATLVFTISNTRPAVNATNITFTDNLNATLSGMVAVAPLPVTPCGAGSQISGTSLLSFTGGNLAAQSTCTFSVTLQVPGNTASHTYSNTTSNLSADIDGNAVVVDPATDVLTVSSDLLSLSKSFTNDPVTPGGSVNLEFVLSNLDVARAATDVTFTDNLDAVLSGLTASGLPVSDICGAGSQLSGTGTVTFSTGSLAAGASCTFSISVQVPSAVALGTIITNTTSQVSGTINGLSVTGDPASDDLSINFLNFSKSFGGPATAGGKTTLNFTIENLSATADVTDIAFSDNLDAVLPGLLATGLPLNDVCGSGAQLSGTTFLTLSGGSLIAGQNCSFSVTLQIPAGAVPGSFTNTTSDLLLAGITAASPATASLSIEPPPVFSKNFAPASAGVGLPSTLSFIIDNSASALTAGNLSFTDNLPAGLIIATPANTSSSCSGGVLTAAPGTGLISYSGGSVTAGSTCTVQLDVVCATPGSFVNTSGALTSSSGISGTANATLTLNPQPLFSKSFTPDSVFSGAVSTLIFTIDNSNSTVAADDLNFTDNLPSGITIAAAPNAVTTCTRGTLQAAAGTGIISYSNGTVNAAGSCTVQVSVTVIGSDGVVTNTSGDLTSSLGNSGPATASIAVVDSIFQDQFESGLQ